MPKLFVQTTKPVLSACLFSSGSLEFWNTLRRGCGCLRVGAASQALGTESPMSFPGDNTSLCYHNLINPNPSDSTRKGPLGLVTGFLQTLPHVAFLLCDSVLIPFAAIIRAVSMTLGRVLRGLVPRWASGLCGTKS